MFTWICPKCGREVPPSYNDCPNCTAAPQPPAAAQEAPAPPQAAQAPYAAPPPPQNPQAPPYGQPAASAPAYAAPPNYAPAPPYNPPPPYGQAPYYPAPRRKMPEWLVMVLVAVGAVGVFALAYFYLLPSSRRSASAAPTVERSTTGRIGASGKEHPYAKFLDVTGIRVIEDAKQNVQVKFLVVNHSSAELAGVGADVIVKPVNATPDTPPVTQFSFKIPTLGAYEAREVTVPAKTKLRAYEMPDWQFLQSEVRITSPK